MKQSKKNEDNRENEIYALEHTSKEQENFKCNWEKYAENGNTKIII